MDSANFLPQRGGYRRLKVFQLSENIYDLTYIFTQKFLAKTDRTVDQMVQAARSGKQNIAEGSAAATTSKETEIKLTNVAKASLQELLLDYEDFLTTRQLKHWSLGEKALEQTRAVIKQEHPRDFYISKAETWSALTLANVVITMIHACDVMLYKLIESQKQAFLAQGGIKEEMSRARRQYRDNNHN